MNLKVKVFQKPVFIFSVFLRVVWKAVSSASLQSYKCSSFSTSCCSVTSSGQKTFHIVSLAVVGINYQVKGA